MTLIKQGIFKKLYNKSRGAIEEARKLHSKYFDEYDNYDCDYDFFSEFCYDIDGVYREAVDTKLKLQNLVETAEQKTDESVKKCKTCIDELDSTIVMCIEDFRNVYGMFNEDFSDMERRTFNNLEIYKVI